MAKSVTVYEKPVPHIGLADWYAKQWELQQSVGSRTSDAFELRNSGRITRSETRVKTEWNTYMNNVRLADRITELSRWGELFEHLLIRLLSEIRLLKDEKADTEKEIDMLNYPLQITAEYKNETTRIDKENLELDRTCANISYKPNALKRLKK
ncbi:hypothetical protein M0802_013119 [Mischocyttarus mexicanus]|nr:hypothetical protein M0802_013119 [Mischocyttarus mexicanus]